MHWSIVTWLWARGVRTSSIVIIGQRLGGRIRNFSLVLSSVLFGLFHISSSILSSMSGLFGPEDNARDTVNWFNSVS